MYTVHEDVQDVVQTVSFTTMCLIEAFHRITTDITIMYIGWKYNIYKQGHSVGRKTKNPAVCYFSYFDFCCCCFLRSLLFYILWRNWFVAKLIFYFNCPWVKLQHQSFFFSLIWEYVTHQPKPGSYDETFLHSQLRARIRLHEWQKRSSCARCLVRISSSEFTSSDSGVRNKSVRKNVEAKRKLDPDTEFDLFCTCCDRTPLD